MSEKSATTESRTALPVHDVSWINDHTQTSSLLDGMKFGSGFRRAGTSVHGGVERLAALGAKGIQKAFVLSIYAVFTIGLIYLALRQIPGADIVSSLLFH